MAALMDMGTINVQCDLAFRYVCCRCLGMVGRPTFPTDPWFRPVEIDDFRVEMVKEGRSLDIGYVEEAIRSSAGRVKAWGPWLACTRDYLCCGLVPAADEVSFGFLVVRKVDVEPTGRARLQVWPDHRDKAEKAMADIRDNFGRHIEARRIERAALALDPTANEEENDPTALAVVGAPEDSLANDNQNTPVATEVT